jgi:hypothetical protein
MYKKILQNKLLIFALVLYATSLFLPAFNCSNKNEHPLGIMILLAGPLGIFTLEFRWLLNLIFFIFTVKILTDSVWGDYILPVVSALAAISCILWTATGVCGEIGSSKSLDIGGYLWVLAMIIMDICYLIEVRKKLFS